MTKRIELAAALFGLTLSAGVPAEDRVELEGTSIIGNRELPKVLYIVPWKQPDPNNLVEPDRGGLLDDVLGPLDRDVFRRQVEYLELIEQSPTGAGSADPGES